MVVATDKCRVVHRHDRVAEERVEQSFSCNILLATPPLKLARCGAGVLSPPRLERAATHGADQTRHPSTLEPSRGGEALDHDIGHSLFMPAAGTAVVVRDLCP